MKDYFTCMISHSWRWKMKINLFLKTYSFNIKKTSDFFSCVWTCASHIRRISPYDFHPCFIFSRYIFKNVRLALRKHWSIFICFRITIVKPSRCNIHLNKKFSKVFAARKDRRASKIWEPKNIQFASYIKCVNLWV